MYKVVENRPAYVGSGYRQNIGLDINVNGYYLQVDCCEKSPFCFSTCRTNNNNNKGGVLDMEQEIKYTILADDGDNIEFEKAIVEHKQSSRSQVNEYRQRIEEIKKHIEEENEEIARLEAEIAELEQVVSIADEKKEQEAKVESENAVAENVVDNVENYQG